MMMSGHRTKDTRGVLADVKEDEVMARSVQLEEDWKLAQLLHERQESQHWLRRGWKSTTKEDRSVPLKDTRNGSKSVVSSKARREPKKTGEAQKRAATILGSPVPTIARKNKCADSSITKTQSLAENLSDGLELAASNCRCLYVLCEINESFAEMLVDTGAQCSVISVPLMTKLGLEDKLNNNYRGTVTGVGKANIVGRVENCTIQINQIEFGMYFTCLDVDKDMLILGVDQMRRFKCQIDLDKLSITFGGVGGVEVACLD